jgi:hypothetical protein
MAPGLGLLVLPGLGRAVGAVALHETGGSALAVLLYGALRALGALRGGPDRTFVPLTREAFWERLALPDTVQREADGSLVYRGLLAHLSWLGNRRLLAGRDFWSATPLGAVFDRGRLVYAYRLAPLGDTPAPGARATTAPAPTAYADEVLQGVAREWDSLLVGFSWLASLLPEAVQARAFGHRGGPAAARRATLVTAGLGALLGLYLLSFLPGPPGDPLAPLVAVAGLGMIGDAGRRFVRLRHGRYAPSLFGFLLPSDSLRPERLAFHAHREAERNTLGGLSRD